MSYRIAPVFRSVPIVPMQSPSTTIVSPLIGEPCATVPAAIRPNRMTAKYSAGPNASAIATTSGVATIMMMMPIDPPTKEAIVVRNRAMPARPCCAIG